MNDVNQELTYEQARAELAAVVERLEAGGTTLEDSLALWERGEQLADMCQRWLDGARARLDAARQQRASSEASEAERNTG
jgi:exodeoxyribonuclease VII small subunit